MDRSDAVGIDFGTSSCKMVAYRDGRLLPVLFGRMRESAFVPSVVRFPPETGECADADPEPIVGAEAKAKWLSEGARTWPSAAPGHGPIKLHLTDPQFGGLTFRGRKYGAPEMAEEILGYLCDEAVQRLGEAPRQAVITVPAYAKRAEIDALKQAARSVLLTVTKTPAEPVAATMAHCHQAHLEGLILAYDFGGGTVDVALLKADGRRYKILRRAGMPGFGGAYLDRLLYTRLLAPRAEEVTGFSLDLNVRNPESDLHGSCGANKQLLLEFAEKARVALSSDLVHEATLRLQLPCPLPSCGERRDNHSPPTAECRLRLTREELEACLWPKIEGTLQKVRLVVSEAGRRFDDIDSILLIGGVTRMPLIQRKMGGLAPGRLVTPHDPDLLVAKGAALVAAHPDYEAVEIDDVLARSLRRRVPSSSDSVVLVKRETSLAEARTTVRGRCREDGRHEVAFTLVEGDGENERDYDELGILRVSSPGDALPKGTPIEVKVEYDRDAEGWTFEARIEGGPRLEATLSPAQADAWTAPALEVSGSTKVNLVLCLDASRSFRRGLLAAAKAECRRLEQQVRQSGIACRSAPVLAAGGGPRPSRGQGHAG